jgi:hypothetical protein
MVAVIAPLTFHLLARGGLKDFNAAVSDLKTAAERAKTQSNTIGEAMGTITHVSSRVNELGVLLASVQEALANTQNTLLEQQTDHSAPSADGAVSPEHNRERIKTLWRGLQEIVEQAASDPKINGNTRARYARMDRRGYLRLIETLLDEHHLSGDPEKWRDAYAIAASAKNASELSEDDVRRMERLDIVLRLQCDAQENRQHRVDGHPEMPSLKSTPLRNSQDPLQRALRTPVPRAPSQPSGSEPPAAH